MTPDERLRLSRTLTYLLRHCPDEFGLELDDEGFVPVPELLESLRERLGWIQPTVEHLEEVIRDSDKARLEMCEGKIRARYGHSVPLRLHYEPAEPPEFLWHGTSRPAAHAIRRHGLRPMGRQYVHLSVDESSARGVGERHDRQPVIFRIRATSIHGAVMVGLFLVTLPMYLKMPRWLENLEEASLWLIFGGGGVFLVGLILSLCRDRLLEIPDKIKRREGIYRFLSWR